MMTDDPLRRLRRHAVTALRPFFAGDAADSDSVMAATIERSLDDYQPKTPRELQLAAQTVGYTLASLACLRTGNVTQKVSLREMMDWHDLALKLNAVSVKYTRALQLRRRERKANPDALTQANTQWNEGEFQLAINQAQDRLSAANARFAACMPALAPKPPAPPIPKLSFLMAEPMTPKVLARRIRA